MGDRSFRAAAKAPLIRRFVRWIGVDRNPLRRRIDRFETAARLLLALAFLICAPLLAPAIGHLSQAAGLRQVQHEASWRQVNAVLLRPAPRQFYGYGSPATNWVTGRWRAPSGASRVGQVPARIGVPAGTKLRIWVNRAGRPTGRRPMTITMVEVRSVLLAIGSVVGLAVALLLLTGLVRVTLNRRRMACWGIEWACFGPRWTTRRWPRS
jgi:hypothetical protein